MPYPQLDLPLEIPGSQYLPLAWSDVTGWSDDDHLAAYKTFRASCQPIAAQTGRQPSPRRWAPRCATPAAPPNALELADDAKAKAFFEENFLAAADLAPRRGRRFRHRLLRADARGIADADRDLQRSGLSPPVEPVRAAASSQASVGLPNKGAVYRKIGRRKLVPYYDRAEIEDGKIEGRGLEIAWLKNQTDLLFAQIQGSARIEFDDGAHGADQLRCL